MARAESRTRIVALFAQTDLRNGTVSVLYTLRCRDWHTLLVGVAGVPNKTATLSNVVFWYAFSIRAARVFLAAWVETVTIVASLSRRTFRIKATADRSATLEGIALKALQASTIGFVCLRVAFSVGTTRIVQKTSLNATALNANVRIDAFVVTLTTNWLAFNLWVSNSAFWTSADGPVSF